MTDMARVQPTELISMPRQVPSIWLGSFTTWQEWQSYVPAFNTTRHVVSDIDDRLIHSRKPFKVQAFCSFCGGAQALAVDWGLSGSGGGEIWPAWTEIAVCESCGLNSRMRAIYDLASHTLNLSRNARVYMPERITMGFTKWSTRFDVIIGSEYVDPGLSSGSMTSIPGFPEQVRHEDMTKLSFPSESFDLIISQDVFEHIPDYAASFGESCRILRAGGRLLFTIPFFPDQRDTETRARIRADGSVEHLLPAEYHGNPVSGSGSLCFSHFGWDILDSLRAQGFSEATANLYWGPWSGHFGVPFFVFSAIR